MKVKGKAFPATLEKMLIRSQKMTLITFVVFLNVASSLAQFSSKEL